MLKLKNFKRWLNFNPPYSLTSTGWYLFNKEFKENAPIRYWLTHDFPNKFILPFEIKYKKLSDSIYYRFKCKNHVLSTGLAPGYHNFNEKLLHVSFNMLKDFVEIEKALLYIFGHNIKYKKSFFKRFRSAEYGVEYLKWETTLSDPLLPIDEQCARQAILAKEVLELYDWWVIKRPLRKERDITLYNDQGLGMFSSLTDFFDKNAEDYKKFKEDTTFNDKLCQEWAKEDKNMLHRLINISHDLWT